MAGNRPNSHPGEHREQHSETRHTRIERRDGSHFLDARQVARHQVQQGSHTP